ncbi:MAG: hypothetical protein M1821_006404 [Bathelium mastoideum]|nr:MAG: hypothetical protein M1821_006404 [Bathelium mastoideum]
MENHDSATAGAKRAAPEVLENMHDAKISRRASSGSPVQSNYFRPPTDRIVIYVRPLPEFQRPGIGRDKFLRALKEHGIDEDSGRNEESKREYWLTSIPPRKNKKEAVEEFCRAFNREAKVECVTCQEVEFNTVVGIARAVKEKRAPNDFQGGAAAHQQTFKPVRQNQAPEDLPFFSQAQKTKRDPYYTNGKWQYLHMSNPGRYSLGDIAPTGSKGAGMAGTLQYKNAKVYLIDTGANIKHDAFKHLDQSQIEWIFPGDPRIQAEAKAAIAKNDFDENGHGTCMLDKVLGLKNGVSKFVNPAIVKVPMVDERYYDGALLADAITLVTKHWRKWQQDAANKGVLMKHAVVNLSLGPAAVSKAREMTEEQLGDVNEAMVVGNKLGLIYVVASGNDGQERITSAPAIFKFKEGKGHVSYFPDLEVEKVNMFLVGAVDNDGQIWGKSNTQPDVEMLFAPGVDVQCADARRIHEYQAQSGTSISTASMSGLIINHITAPNGHISANVKDNFNMLHAHIYDDAWEREQKKERAGVHVKGAWNGIPKPATPADFKKIWEVEYLPLEQDRQGEKFTYSPN